MWTLHSRWPTSWFVSKMHSSVYFWPFPNILGRHIREEEGDVENETHPGLRVEGQRPPWRTLLDFAACPTWPRKTSRHLCSPFTPLPSIQPGQVAWAHSPSCTLPRPAPTLARARAGCAHAPEGQAVLKWERSREGPAVSPLGGQRPIHGDLWVTWRTPHVSSL